MLKLKTAKKWVHFSETALLIRQTVEVSRSLLRAREDKARNIYGTILKRFHAILQRNMHV
jgi:hypothetical protein